MALEFERITIIRARRPVRSNVNDELQWLGRSLGLFSLRDKDSSCFRVFIELLKTTKHEGITSDELAYKLGLSRGTVIHHMNKLMDAGLVVANKNRYLLRVDNLQVLVDEIQKDMERTMLDMKEIAEHIDKNLGL